MREKKPYMVLSFHSTTEAMAMERRCQEQSIPGRIIPLPREISAGCGLAWRMTPEEYALWQPELERLSLKYQQAVELKFY